MPYFTIEIIWTIGIEIILIIAEVYLIYYHIRRYFKSDYPKTLLILILVLLTSFITDVINLSSMFVSYGNLEFYEYYRKLSLLSTVISVYFLLLLFELFEHETLFTELQMLNTVITTIVGITILIGIPQVIWLDHEQIYVINFDSLTYLLVMLFPITIGVFVIASLRNSLKDVWINQKRQLIAMIIGISVCIFVPFILKVIHLFYSSQFSIISESLEKIPIIIGFILFTYSFGDPSQFSLYYRRKADKILVTNLNGIPLFHYDFKENVHYINETLFSGAVVAITMLMSESIKSPSPIAEVLMKNKYRLLLETKQSFIALILTPQGNSYLRNSLECFATAFDQKFTSIITSGEVLDLNLFIRSGLSILFDNFGISKRNIKEIISRLTFEESLT
ncbi:MAG: hypothetical protein ACFFAU_05705 [Candidatus Hodarchaeota archaeon]